MSKPIYHNSPAQATRIVCREVLSDPNSQNPWPGPTMDQMIDEVSRAALLRRVEERHSEFQTRVIWCIWAATGGFLVGGLVALHLMK